jgi:hypothetical protein
MDANADNLDSILKISTLKQRASAQAIDYVGDIVDRAYHSKRADVLRHVVGLTNTIDRAKADVSCAPKMSQLKTIESRPGKGCDEEAFYRRTDRGHSS